MNWAANNGHLDVVKWLHYNRSEGCTVAAMNWAANNNHLNVIKWLHENRTEGCTCNAMRWSDIEIIQWLSENRIEIYIGKRLNYVIPIKWANNCIRIIKWAFRKR